MEAPYEVDDTVQSNQESVNEYAAVLQRRVEGLQKVIDGYVEYLKNLVLDEHAPPEIKGQFGHSVALRINDVAQVLSQSYAMLEKAEHALRALGPVVEQVEAARAAAPGADEAYDQAVARLKRLPTNRITGIPPNALAGHVASIEAYEGTAEKREEEIEELEAEWNSTWAAYARFCADGDIENASERIRTCENGLEGPDSNKLPGVPDLVWETVRAHKVAVIEIVRDAGFSTRE